MLKFPINHRQAGFTLIELIAVIVILGILAATALPRFADLGANARHAKMLAARGAVVSAVSLVRGKWLVGGDTSATSVMIEGYPVSVHPGGYPAGAAIGTVAGLASTDYTIAPSTLTTIADPKKPTCVFTYTPGTGVVGAAPALADC